MRQRPSKSEDNADRVAASELPKPRTPDPGVSEKRGAVDHAPKKEKNKR